MDKFKKYAKKNDLDKLAKYILSNICLCINGDDYRLLEIELYIYNDQHKDIFAHCHNEQTKFLTWYFHQMSEKEHSYKGGTFKGLDITCGINGGYGGILLRTIMNEKTGRVTEGPCNVVNEILLRTNQDSIKEFVIDNLSKDKLSCVANPLLFLHEKEYADSDIYVAPRIGLTLKGDFVTEKEKYIHRKYRYIIFKSNIKKEKKKMTLLK
jgi:3-methyladenine DNA glycosylase Mpg